MHILASGAGALGYFVAAYLTRAGETVTVLVCGARASYLRASGLRLCGVAEFTVPCTVVTDPRTVQEVEALVVVVRVYDTASALAGLRHLRVQSVFSVEKGLLKHEQLASAFGAQKTIGAACLFASEVLASGAVRYTLERESSPRADCAGRRSPRPRPWCTPCASPACRRCILNVCIPLNGRNWGFFAYPLSCGARHEGGHAESRVMSSRTRISRHSNDSLILARHDPACRKPWANVSAKHEIVLYEDKKVYKNASTVGALRHVGGSWDLCTLLRHLHRRQERRTLPPDHAELCCEEIARTLK